MFNTRLWSGLCLAVLLLAAVGAVLVAIAWTLSSLKQKQVVST